MKYDIDQINSLISSRRSVFPTDYSEDIIPDETIQQILENANWAPNHKRTEPWRFLVYAGDGLKELGRIQSDHYKRITQQDGSFNERKYENLARKPSEASHVIVIGMRRDPDKRVREIEEVEAVACAVQNMYLTAEAYGLACYWGTGGITYMEDAQKQFGWGDEDKLIGFFYLGIPKSEPVAGKRGPVEEKVTWIKS